MAAEIDFVDTNTLTCSECGTLVYEVTCPVHGPQDGATIHDSELRCLEWNYDTDTECWERLEVNCVTCGMVEADLDELLEVNF